MSNGMWNLNAKEVNKTKIISLYGGPGCGKSTGMAYIFSQLKMKGLNCEMAPEYAKNRVWQEDFKVFENQFYVTAKQSQMLHRLRGKVDVIITDSPILIGYYYGQNLPYATDYGRVLHAIYSEYDNYDYLLTRVKEYNPAGRFQNEEEAKNIDKELKKVLNRFNIQYKEFEGYKEGYDLIIEDFLKNS